MKKVALVMDGLLSPNGDFIYSGGDRYTRDLAHLLRDMGVTPVIFQRSDQAFAETWEGVEVRGLPAGKKAGQLNTAVVGNTQEYHAHIFFHMMLAYPSVPKRSVSISHGIWFDHVQHPPCADDKWQEWRMNLESAMAGPNRIVSVDTNTINFFGGLFAGRYHHKFCHIPNAVDVNLYKPSTTKRKGNYRVLFPRRFDALRGSTEMTRIADDLHNTHKDWEWHLCGATHSDGVKEAVEKWASRSERYSYYRKTFDEMPQVYRDSDICVIPTMGCEGTSYSCLPPGTDILTIEGPKPVESIEVGEMVLTHAGRYRAVTELMNKPANELIEVCVPTWGTDLKLTPNHPVLAIKPPKRKNGRPVVPGGKKLRDAETAFWKEAKPDWMPAGELERGDVIVFPRYKAQPDYPRVLDLSVMLDPKKYAWDEEHVWNRFSNHPGQSSVSEVAEALGISKRSVYAGRQEKSKALPETRAAVMTYMQEHGLSDMKKVPRFVNVNADLMRLLGYYVAEGFVTKGAVKFAFHVEETDYHKDVIELLDSLFCVNGEMNPSTAGKGCCIHSYSAVVRDVVVSLCGTGARKKKVPLWFYDLPEELIASFLKGAFRGDGYYGSVKTSSYKLNYVSASLPLIWQMVTMLTRLNLRPRVVKRFHPNHEPTWAIDFGGSQAKELAERMGEELDFAPRTRSAHSQTWSDDDYMYVPITSVERLPYEGLVYNFEVDEDHTYVAEGMVVHNCLESLASGVPTVTTYVGGLSELVIDGHNGIKVAPFYEDLRDAVDYLIRNPKERIRMGYNARQTAQQFSMDRWRASWSKVIEDLLR